MQDRPKLVSIIMPAYNAVSFITEAIHSVLAQTYSNWELFIINDGSTDNTQLILDAFSDKRINVITQPNKGVTFSRNRGFDKSTGEFVIFFDADDLMSTDFISTRVAALATDSSLGFAGGVVETFPISIADREAVASDPENQILFFSSGCVTVPSNYIFRSSVLRDNGIRFNDQLSSSADRFFILEVSKCTTGITIPGPKGKLLYRFNAQSMSNFVTPKLIRDNEKFYFELKRKSMLPKDRTRKFKSFYFLSLAIGFGMVKHWKGGVKYMAMSFFSHPLFFTRNFGKRVASMF